MGKIKADKNWPFYNAYHEDEYIDSHDCKREIVLMEQRQRKSKYHLFNDSNKEIVVYRIDGGVIKSNDDCKCDYGLYTEDQLLRLVELKGGDYKQALKQILRTIRILFAKKEVTVCRLDVRVVLSKMRSPDILPTEEKKLRKLLMAYGNGTFDKKTQLMKERI